MKVRAWTLSVHSALLALLFFVAPGAYAVTSCSAAVTAISVFYNPTNPTDLNSSGTYTISCTRDLSDPASVVYSLAAGLGLHAQGANRRVHFSGSYYRYGLFMDAGMKQRWESGNNQELQGSVPFNPGAVFGTASGQFFFQVAAGQAVGPAGTYTDLPSTTLTYGPTNLTSVGALNVSVTSITNCVLTLPATLTFNYISFQATAATPSVNFLVNCTTGLPYTIALDNTGPILDDAVNLTYTLGLSAAGGTGAGVDQIYQINGNMPANQSGTCTVLPCTNAAATNKTRTLTVTY